LAGLVSRKSDIKVVKIGDLVPNRYELRADWMMALTPGVIDQDLERLDYKLNDRPWFPWDAAKNHPFLKAQLIPFSGEE
jgi:microcystin degradation protein MlrC